MNTTSTLKKAAIITVGFVSAIVPGFALSITSVVETGLGADAPAVVGESFVEDSLTFSDRTHQHNSPAFNSTTGLLSTTGDLIVDLPAYLAGNPYVRFANNAREQTGYSAVVTADQAVVFYLLVDNRLNGPASVGTKTNTTDPILGGPLQWVLDGGWVRVNTGISPNGQGDFTGVDESGDGSLNQFYSIYRLPVIAAQVTVKNNGIGGQNMISLVAAPAPVVVAEPIVSFSALPSISAPGDTVNLSWFIASNATSAVLNPGNINVLPSTSAQGVGSHPLKPLADATYTLKVVTPTATETESASFVVKPLASFTASITYADAGSPITLSWFVRPDAAVSISGIGSVKDKTDATGHGSLIVNPQIRTTYLLTAEAGDKKDESEITVVIKPPGETFALIDLGGTGGRPEAGAADDREVGAGGDGTNLTDLALTELQAADGTPFSITIDNMDRLGGAVGGLDWRDRGDGPGSPLTKLAEDHVKNNQGSIRVTLAGLPAGSYNITAYTLDVANSQSEQILIFATDALRTAEDTGVVADASYPGHPANTGAPGTSARLTTAFVDSKGFIIPVRSNGVKDVILYFDGTTATDIEVPLAALWIRKAMPASPAASFAITSISRTVIGNSANVTLGFPSTAGASYRIQTSPNLISWTTLSDNYPASATPLTSYLDAAIPLSEPRRYYQVIRK